MNIRPWARFKADFPIDELDDERGNIVEYPGRIASGAMAEILRRLSCEVDEPQHAYERGWEFNFQSRGRNLWCQIGFMGDDWLFTCDHSSLLGLSQKNWEEQGYILAHLNEEMAKNPQFQDVRWYTGEELETDFPGAPFPVSDEGQEDPSAGSDKAPPAPQKRQEAATGERRGLWKWLAGKS